MTQLLADEGRAAAEFVFVGKHVGEFGGVAPTGNKVRLPYSAFYDVEDGAITAVRVYLSVDQLVAQARGDASVQAEPVG